MYASFVAVALSALLAPGGSSQDPQWLKDYGQARKQGKAEGKPLVVIIGTGEKGSEKVCEEGKLNAEVRKALAESYVCLYVDTEHIQGRELAESFKMGQG